MDLGDLADTSYTVEIGSQNISLTISDLAQKDFSSDEPETMNAIKNLYYAQVTAGLMETVEAVNTAVDKGFLIKWGSGGNYDYLYQTDPLLGDLCSGDDNAIYPPANPDYVNSGSGNGSGTTTTDVNEITQLTSQYCDGPIPSYAACGLVDAIPNAYLTTDNYYWGDPTGPHIPADKVLCIPMTIIGDTRASGSFRLNNESTAIPEGSAMLAWISQTPAGQSMNLDGSVSMTTTVPAEFAWTQDSSKLTMPGSMMFAGTSPGVRYLNLCVWDDPSGAIAVPALSENGLKLHEINNWEDDISSESFNLGAAQWQCTVLPLINSSSEQYDLQPPGNNNNIESSTTSGRWYYPTTGDYFNASISDSTQNNGVIRAADNYKVLPESGGQNDGANGKWQIDLSAHSERTIVVPVQVARDDVLLRNFRVRVGQYYDNNDSIISDAETVLWVSDSIGGDPLVGTTWNQATSLYTTNVEYVSTTGNITGMNSVKTPSDFILNAGVYYFHIKVVEQNQPWNGTPNTDVDYIKAVIEPYTASYHLPTLNAYINGEAGGGNETPGDTGGGDGGNPGGGDNSSDTKCVVTTNAQSVFDLGSTINMLGYSVTCTEALAQCLADIGLVFDGTDQSRACLAAAANSSQALADTPLPEPNGADTNDNTGPVIVDSPCSNNPYRQAPGPGSSAYIRRLRAGETEASIKRENDQWWKWRTDNGCIQGGLTFGGGSVTNSDGGITYGGLTFYGTSQTKTGNFNYYNNHPQTGSGLYPAGTKRTGTKTVDPNLYGFNIPLSNNQPVNATTQRISGNRVVPLASPLAVIPDSPRPLRSSVDTDNFNRAMPSNIGRTYRNLYYDPRSTGASFSSNGRRIQNIRNGAFSEDGSLISSEINDIPGTTSVGRKTLASKALSVPVGIPLEFAPTENADIIYSKRTEATILPLNADGSPAGPAASVKLKQSAPSIELSSRDFAGVKDGSELYLGGAKVVIKGQDPIQSIASQINCQTSAIKAYVNTTTGPSGQTEQELIVESCDSNPWNIINGCAGGEIRQVGDFHVNKGFEQSRTLTSQLLPPLITNVPDKANVTNGNHHSTANLMVAYTDTDFPSTGRLVDINFNAEDWNGSTVVLDDVPYPSLFPQETITESKSGTGYRKGDRLRLVGGTPINSNKGPLTHICIDDRGKGYTDPENITVRIGDGTTPGTGAAAIVRELDENGGIIQIDMINYGVGYDPSRPPVITVENTAPSNWAQQAILIDGVNQFNEVSLSAGDYFKYTFTRVSSSVETMGVAPPVIEQIPQYFRVNNNLEDGASYVIGGTVSSDLFEFNRTGPDLFVPQVLTVHLADITVARGATVTLTSSGSGSDADLTNALGNWLVIDHATGPAGAEFDKPILYNTSLQTYAKMIAIANEIDQGNVTLTRAAEFDPAGNMYNDFIPVANPGLGKAPAQLNGLIGVDPSMDPNSVGDGDINTPFVGGLDEQGFRALGGPLRVAKFLVTNVDATGAITGLKILDRGLYKVFPSDLTLGIPLEYDYEPVGVESAADSTIGTSKANRDTLGGVDPLRNNILYGGQHPEYAKLIGNNTWATTDPGLFSTALGQSDMIKHRDWAGVTEYKLVSGGETVQYFGTPGAYDPSTFVEGNIQGITTKLSKTNELDIDPQTGTLRPDGNGYKTPERLAGGRGARVFLTAQIVPDCSEKGTAREDLGLPDVVTQLDAPKAFVNAANTGLTDVGYDPEVITWTVINPEGPIPDIELDTTFPGVRFTGFDWMGIPDGDYNNGILCVVATLSEQNLSETQLEDELEKIYNSAGGISSESLVITPDVEAAVPAQINQQRVTNTALTLACIQSLRTDPNSWFDNTEVTRIQELYQYDITNVFGTPLTLGKEKQEADIFYFQSNREQNYVTQDLDTDLIANPGELYTQPSMNSAVSKQTRTDIDYPVQTWYDSLTLTGSESDIQANYPGFVNGGWAYKENGIIKRWQTPMVDTKFIHNSLIYNPDTGSRITDLDFWDPFKGILPGFMKNEISYISENDPVNYNLDRTMFGKNQVGKIWWNTSTLRYQWYEQGTNRERWENWGKAFPGSTITICEWVESRAVPQNWTGDGTPLYTDQYITERHYNRDTHEYNYFYYYWVQNRSVIDPVLQVSQGRNFDARTLARYISNPITNGVPMISFLNSSSIMLSNIGDVIRDDKNHLQINLSRDLDPNGIKHTAWALHRESDLRDYLPDMLINKVIDSLAEQNATGQVVPDPGLSEVQKYGIQYRPRQSVFRNSLEARRTMAYVINEQFANINLYTEYPNWNSNLPDESQWQYIQRVTWYETIYVDVDTNQKIRYDDSYKPIFNVDNVGDLKTLRDLPDGTVVQVGTATSAAKELWLYNQTNNDFKRIAIQNDTIKLRDSVFGDVTAIMSSEIRALLQAMNTSPLRGLNLWNTLFFELLKYAYMEQGQLDWAFKSSYIFVDKNEEDLIKIPGFKPDNFENIQEYMNEAKPYNAKIREYKDGKSPPVETIGTIKPTDLAPGVNQCGNRLACVPGMPGEDLANCSTQIATNPNAGLRSVSDFDKPPYVDPILAEVRILDDYNPADASIISSNPDYINYASKTSKSTDPFRRNNITLTIDRTNWQLTEFAWNANTTPLASSIARNISKLQLSNVSTVSAEANTRAVDRIFKMDSDVQEQYARDVLYHYDVYDSFRGNVSSNAYTIGSYVRQRSTYTPYSLYRANANISYGTSFNDNLASGNLVLVEAPYDEISQNVAEVTNIVDSGDLNFTLAMVKTKVGGDFRGETLDASIFTKLVPGGDPYYDYNTILGWDTELYEDFYWDIVDKVNNYVGIFREPPAVNLRRNDTDKSGFDSITFKKTLGEDRPEELVYVSPFETLIINTYTNTETSNIIISGNNISLGANGSITAVTVPQELTERSFGTVMYEVHVNSDTGANAILSLNLTDLRINGIDVVNGGTGYDSNTTVGVVAKLPYNSAPVETQITYSLYGDTEYQRVRNKTTLAKDFMSYSEEIEVTDSTYIEDPSAREPGMIWLGHELVQYKRKIGNVLSILQRGMWGTTIQDHLATDTQVFSGHTNQTFNDLDPEKAVWLELGDKYDPFDDFDSDRYAHNAPIAPKQPGFDFADANIISNVLMVSATPTLSSEGVVNFALNANITTSISASKIYADISSNANVQLFSTGYDGFDTRAQAYSDASISGTISGDVSITEHARYLTNTVSITNTITVSSTSNLYSVAEQINNMGFSSVTADVISYYDNGDVDSRLQLRGYDFTITDIPSSTNISTGTYSAELFPVSITSVAANTIIIKDDLFANTSIVGSMTNVTVGLVVDPAGKDKIPYDYANVYAGTALSLADRANVDTKNPQSIMKFVHNMPTFIK